MSVSLFLFATLVLILFWRFRYRRRWWRLDAGTTAIILVFGAIVGLPMAGLWKSLGVGVLAASVYEATVILAWFVALAIQPWTPRVFENDNRLRQQWEANLALRHALETVKNLNVREPNSSPHL